MTSTMFWKSDFSDNISINSYIAHELYYYNWQSKITIATKCNNISAYYCKNFYTQPFAYLLIPRAT